MCIFEIAICRQLYLLKFKNDKVSAYLGKYCSIIGIIGCLIKVISVYTWAIRPFFV